MPRLSLRAKVLIFTMAIIAILLVTSHLVTSTLVANSLRDQLERRALHAAESLGEWIATRSERIGARAQMLASSDWLHSAVDWRDPSWLGAVLRQQLPRIGEPEVLMIESTGGGWVYTVVEQPLRYGSGLPRRASELPEQRWMEGLAEAVPDADQLLLTVSVPVRTQSEVLGLLTIGSRIDAAAVDDIRYVCGCDQLSLFVGGELLLTSFPEELREDAAAGLPAAGPQRQGSFSTQVGSEEYLTRVRPLVSSAGEEVAHLLVQFSDRESRKLLADISNALNLSALGAFIVFSVLSVFFSGRVTTQLKVLVDHVSALGEGRYEEPVRVAARDEVGLLADSFEELRVKLRQRTEELQRSEAFLRRLVEGTTNAIFTLDSEGLLTFMNPQLAELTGFADERLLGTPLAELADPAERERTEETIASVLERGLSVGGRELTLRRADGGSLIALLSLAPLAPREEGRAAVGALADITELKKLEDQLLRSERLASMGQIAAGVAHEINNPLGIVLGFTQDLLAARGDDDPDSEPLRVIERETTRCARVVKDLLDLARAGEAKQEPLELESLLDKTLKLFTIHLRDGDIGLETDYARVPPVLGDEQQLQQVFMNVILNSIHAMDGGGTLQVALRPAAGVGAEVRIEDSGYGIGRDELKHIFDPFYSSKREAGSGLGLFIVHRLVDAHGGRVEIESEPGRGTVCTITLPAAE